jgi:ubiquinone/menaquinone biosynthesis C-methylase UbiE
MPRPDKGPYAPSHAAARTASLRQEPDTQNWEKTLDLTRARLAPEAEVLELGCGTGSSALRIAPFVSRYTGTDDASGMMEIAREKLAETPVEGLTFDTARTGDGSLPEGPFDAVLAFNLLHLVPDLPATLAEAHRLLKPGGLLITKTPCLGGNRFAALWPVVGVLRLVGKAPPLTLHQPRTAGGGDRLRGVRHP